MKGKRQQMNNKYVQELIELVAQGKINKKQAITKSGYSKSGFNYAATK